MNPECRNAQCNQSLNGGRPAGKHTAHFSICRHRRFMFGSKLSANRQSLFMQAFWSSTALQRKNLETAFHGAGSPVSI